MALVDDGAACPFFETNLYHSVRRDVGLADEVLHRFGAVPFEDGSENDVKKVVALGVLDSERD